MTNSKIKFVVVALFAMGLSLTSCGTKSNNSTNKETVNNALVSEVFTVYGNCGMCEKTIEGSLDDVKGITSGDWNKDNDLIEVTYDPSIITLDQIKQRIADVGYDSDSHRAKDEVYNDLPGCCQYDRPE